MAQKANSLSHTKWLCKYHIVFAPKYRRKIIYGQYKERYTKFYKVQFTEPSESGNSKQESIQFDTPTLTAKAIYRLSDGLSYAKADEEAAGFAAETGTKWYEQV